MNKKVWRKDKKLMVIVNATANNILVFANSRKVFSEILKEAFSGALNIGHLNLESLENVNIATELEDRFLQSAVFCVSMWERGLLQLKVMQSELDKKIVTPQLQSIISEDGDISIITTIKNLATRKGEPTDIYAEFNQFRANLVMLLASDKLLIEFTGAIDEFSEPDMVPDSYMPQFRIGYLQPGLILTKPSTGEDGEVRFEPATAIAAITVTTTVTTFSGMLGHIVGTAESR